MLRVRRGGLMWTLPLAAIVACSQPTPASEPLPEPEAQSPDETAASGLQQSELDLEFVKSELCNVGVGDPLIGAGPCPPERDAEEEDQSAFEPANREAKAARARKARGKRDSEVEKANAKPWESLPPARVSQSAYHCIGYCFDAVLGAVDEKNSRLAQVVVFDRRGRPTRAFVERTRLHDWGPEVRYVCFDRVMDGGVPRFTDCMQTGRDARAPTASKGAAEDANDWADDPLGDGPFPGL